MNIVLISTHMLTTTFFWPFSMSPVCQIFQFGFESEISQTQNYVINNNIGKMSVYDYSRDFEQSPPEKRMKASKSLCNKKSCSVIFLSSSIVNLQPWRCLVVFGKKFSLLISFQRILDTSNVLKSWMKSIDSFGVRT